MSSAHRPPRSHLLIAVVLTAVFLLQSFLASSRKSPVFDEPPHIASGLSYISTHVFHANLQHPPLLKEISAISLRIAGISWPADPMAKAIIQGGPRSAMLEWPVGNNIIHDNGADRTLFWARLPFILLSGILAFLIYWWGRELVGSVAALGALFLFAFDPTLIAHSALVTTDVGLAVFTFIFLFALWRYVEAPGWRRLTLCGLALGAVLAAKFSAVFLLPVAAVLLAVSLRWPAALKVAPPPVDARFAKASANSPCPCGSGKKFKRCHGESTSQAAASAASSGLPAMVLGFASMFGIAVLVIEILYFFPSDPLLYIVGLKRVNADHIAGYSAYLHGQLSPHFMSYFAIAYLLKEPLASVLLCVGGLIFFLRSQTPVLKKWFVLLPPAVLFLAPTIWADNMGIRYIIPTLPFVYLLGGIALARLSDGTLRWGKYAAAILCLWMVVEAAAIFPDHLSYFNESACLLESPSQIGLDGGTRCGPLWLDDSNVDWGQGFKQLRAWTDHNLKGRPLHLAAFSSYPPEGYGIPYQKVEMSTMVTPPPPGLYAVSSNFVARMPTLAATGPGGDPWLSRLTPIAIVGHAFYIYDVR